MPIVRPVVIASCVGVVVAGGVLARRRGPVRECAVCMRTWRARDVARCHRCGVVACERCMQRAADVHELPLCVIESPTCGRCVKHSRWALQRYEEALRDLDAVAIFPEEFDDLAPTSGLNLQGLPHALRIETSWHSDQEAALRELKLVARFHLFEMVRHFRLVRKRGVFDGHDVTLYAAAGEASTTATYGVLKPGINF